MASVFVFGAFALGLSVVGSPPRLSVQAILLALAVLLSENYMLSIPPYTLSLSYPLTLAAVVLCGPATAGIVAAISSTSYQDLRERKPLEVVAFNMGQLLLVTCVGAWTYGWLGGRVLQSAPASFQPRVEQLTVGRAMIPDGDRRQGAQSGDVDREREAIAPRHQYIVCVLVLGDYRRCGHRWIEGACPGQHVAQVSHGCERVPQGSEQSGGNAGTIEHVRHARNGLASHPSWAGETRVSAMS